MVLDITEQESDLWRTFYVMRRQLELTLERRLQADAGISGADYEVLVALHGSTTKRLRAGQIGELIGWEKSRVSHQITRMEQRGLLKRQECDDDARGVWIVITDEGSRAILSTSGDRTLAVREYFFDLLSDDEKAALLSISRKVLDKIEPPVCAELDGAGARDTEPAAAAA